MRDLQKSGRIGRIEVENESKEGISKGFISIPSSLTRKETALLAATVETVTRVGPCEAEIQLLGIKDVRETKRKKIIERAAELLKEWDQKSLEPSEIEERIETDIKLGEIISWGPDGLPAGPDVESNPELIIVEGRADVLNLLRIGIKNSVAVQGTQVPKSVIEIAEKKSSVTAFLDGDRGGTIILNELKQLTKLDFIARAPEGYEVEELTRKQLIKALQNKKPADTYHENSYTEDAKESEKNVDSFLEKSLKKLKVKHRDPIITTLREIEPGHSIGLNKNSEVQFNLPVRDLYDNLSKFDSTEYLIIYGILTNRLISLALDMKIKFIACKNKEQDLKIPNQIFVYSF
ncbi:MAG: DNA primase [Promethearchaeota archaeon]|nr:MAG: DNA primase [Candidatus Lokiarchaeota archaeon]